MNSVGSPGEEVKLNTPVPVPHTIPFYSSPPPFFPKVSNPDAEKAKEIFPGEGEVIEEAGNVFVQEKEGNTAALSGDLIMDSVESPEEEVKLNTPVPETHINSCKDPTSLYEAWTSSAVIGVVSDNSGSECNNKIVKETDTTDGGSVKPYSPSGM